jgi:AAA domain/DnaB-like helicase N terminal domain
VSGRRHGRVVTTPRETDRLPDPGALAALELTAGPVARQVISLAILEPEQCAATVAQLPAALFHKEAARTILARMRALLAGGAMPDLVTLTNALRAHGELDDVGGAGYVSQLEAPEVAPVPGRLPGLIAQLQHAAMQRAALRRSHVLSQAVEPNGAGPAPTELLTAERDFLAELEALAGVLPAAASGAPVGWPLHDAAASWDFPPPPMLVETLMPAKGLMWIAGAPKVGKSLFTLYMVAAIGARRPAVAGRFPIHQRPRVVYLSAEDGGGRVNTRLTDIVTAWGGARPDPNALAFVLRPRGFNLETRAHAQWLLETCQANGAGGLVLDTWGRILPGAPMRDDDYQKRLAEAAARLAEDLGALVVVVDHTRKRAADAGPISAQDILGTVAKAAISEHNVVLGETRDRHRVEVYVEGKDADGARFFLDRSPRGSGLEKFTWGGTVEDAAARQRAVGDANREAIAAALGRNRPAALQPAELVAVLKAEGVTLSVETASRHCRALTKLGRAVRVGAGAATSYAAASESRQGPSAVIDAIGGADDE